MKSSRTKQPDINNSMTNNVIEFPLERRLEQMAIEDGFMSYSTYELADLDTDKFLSDLLTSMYNDNYRIDDERHVTDVSFLYETLKSFVYKMNNFDHPIQLFSAQLYSDQSLDPEQSPQLEFDF